MADPFSVTLACSVYPPLWPVNDKPQNKNNSWRSWTRVVKAWAVRHTVCFCLLKFKHPGWYKLLHIFKHVTPKQLKTTCKDVEVTGVNRCVIMEAGSIFFNILTMLKNISNTQLLANWTGGHIEQVRLHIYVYHIIKASYSWWKVCREHARG